MHGPPSTFYVFLQIYVKVHERLKLGSTNEEAAGHMQLVISDSIGLIIPEIMEKFHRMAQILRG